MIVRFICLARKERFKVKYFRAKLSISRSLLTSQLPGAFRSSCCFIYFKSHTYNYLVNGQRALIWPKLSTRTIVFEPEGVTIKVSLHHGMGPQSLGSKTPFHGPYFHNEDWTRS